jgi:CubicO group peptidase (beta-lactamase class C family)
MAHRFFQFHKNHAFSVLCTGAIAISTLSYQNHVNKRKLPSVTYSDDSHNSSTRARLLAAQPDLDKIFQKHLEDHHIPGLIYGVTLNGELVMHGSKGSVTASSTARDGTPPSKESSMFRIASMSKSFTAMAIIHLRDRGLLKLTDPVFKYVPEVKQIASLTADCPPLTIGHLLTMQGGFPQDDPWGDRLLDMTDEDFSKLLTSGLYRSNPTGAVYEYSNLGYAILGLVIKNITHTSYQEYITRHIFHPLGMNNTVFESDEAGSNLVQGYRWEENVWKEEPMLHDGAFGAMGGIITTVDDFVKYMSFHQSAWVEGGAQSVPLCRSSVREMHFPWSVDGVFLEKQSASLTPLPASSTSALLPEGGGGTGAVQSQPQPLSQSLSQSEHGSALAGVWSEAYGYGLKSCRDMKGIRWIRHAGGLPGFRAYYIKYYDIIDMCVVHCCFIPPLIFIPLYMYSILLFSIIFYYSLWQGSAVSGASFLNMGWVWLCLVTARTAPQDRRITPL